jgi:hypothetical protein
VVWNAGPQQSNNLLLSLENTYHRRWQRKSGRPLPVSEPNAGKLTYPQQRKKGITIMNSYEASEVLTIGNAHELILGQKVIDFSEDSPLGPGFRTDDQTDIDESDE